MWTTTILLAAAAASPEGEDAVFRHLEADRAPWVASFGGGGAEYATGCASTSDGGTYVAGRTTSFGTGQIQTWVARLGPRGEVRFEVVLGGAGRDELGALLETPDGGCLLAGFTSSFGAGDLDGWLVKLSPAGAIEWQKTYGGPGEESFTALDASPNGYYVGGVVDANGDDAWILEVAPDGSVLWQQRMGGTTLDRVTSLVATPEGPVFTAISDSRLNPEEPAVTFFRPWLVALDEDGDVRWQRAYDYSGGDAWNHVIALPDGGFVVVGEIIAMGFNRGDVWLVRLDEDGDVVWDWRYGDHFRNNWVDSGVEVRPRANGGFLVAATTGTASPGGNEAIWLMALDENGILEWDRVYGDFAFFGGAVGLAVGARGSVTLVGFQGGDVQVLRLLPGGRAGPACRVTHSTSPNIWIGPLSVHVAFGATVATSFVPADSGSTTLSVSSRLFVCGPR